MSLPSIFKKRYTEKKLEKAVLRHVYIVKDKEYLRGLFKPGEDGLFAADLGPELTKEEEKRLKALAKDIKANKGVVSLPKAAVLLVLLGGAAVSYYVFRNVIAEKAVEGGLEAVFGAKADVLNADFDLFGGKISWARLEVADRDRPMKNLFETGKTDAGLAMGALLKGRIVVENLEARDVRWNTDRTESGALAERPEPEKKDSSPGLAAAAAGKALSAIASIDPKEILDKESDRLKTKKLAEKLNEDFKKEKDAWTEKTGTAKTTLASLGTEVKGISALKMNDLKNPNDALAAYNKVTAALPKIQEAGKAAEALKKDFEASLKAVEKGKKDLEKAVEEDYAFVESLVNLSSGEAASLAKELFAGYAAEHLGNLYVYGLRAVEIAARLAADGKKDEGKKKAQPARGRGRDIVYAAERIPRFHLKRAAFGAGGAGGPALAGSLAEVSSDPDLTGRPAVFDLSYADGKASTTLKGSIDSRKAAKDVFAVAVASEGLPLALSFPASALGIGSLKGPLSVKAAMTTAKDGGMKGSAEALVKKPQVERAGAKNLMTDLLVSVISGAEALDAEFTYSADAAGKISLTASSSLDKLVKARLSAFVKEQEKKYREQLKKELAKRLEGLLAENAALRKGYAELEKAVGGNYTDAAAYKKAAEDKRKEIEKRIEDLRKQAADALLKQTEKALPAAPKLPKVPKLR